MHENVQSLLNNLGTSPHIFMNVDFSEMVTVSVEGTTVLLFPAQTATVTKPGKSCYMVEIQFVHTHTYCYSSFFCNGRIASSWYWGNSCST